MYVCIVINIQTSKKFLMLYTILILKTDKETIKLNNLLFLHRLYMYVS